jgi:hypothetical protein
MEGLEPTVVGKPSFAAAPDVVHENLLQDTIWPNARIKRRGRTLPTRYGEAA